MSRRIRNFLLAVAAVILPDAVWIFLNAKGLEQSAASAKSKTETNE